MFCGFFFCLGFFLSFLKRLLKEIVRHFCLDRFSSFRACFSILKIAVLHLPGDCWLFIWKDLPFLNDGSLYPRTVTSLEILHSFRCPLGLSMIWLGHSKTFFFPCLCKYIEHPKEAQYLHSTWTPVGELSTVLTVQSSLQSHYLAGVWLSLRSGIMCCKLWMERPITELKLELKQIFMIDQKFIPTISALGTKKCKYGQSLRQYLLL